MIPGFDFIEFAQHAGVVLVVLVVTAIIFAESGLLIGFFLPGDSLLFTAGFLIKTGVLPINLYLFIAIIFVAAVLGDSVGYSFGRRVGRRLFRRPNSRFFKQEYVRQAEVFYENHGPITIMLARFMPIVRTFVPIIAGTAKMSYRTFFLYNVAGGFLWTAGVTSAGFILGSLFEKLGIDIDTVIIPIVLVIIILSIMPPIIHIFKDKKNRQTLFDASKRQLRSLGDIFKKSS